MEQKYWWQPIVKWVSEHPHETAFAALLVVVPLCIPMVRSVIGAIVWPVVLIGLWERFGLAEAFAKLRRR